jgi:hypothetical protein
VVKWYIFPVLVYCIEKNLATLVRNRLYCGKNIDIGPAEEQKVRREGGRPDQKKKKVRK